MKLHKWNDIKAKKFSPEKVREIRESALAELREMDLTAIREAAGLTQTEVAAKLEATQSHLSKIESRGDHRISTVRRFVEAIGGDLEVVAIVKGKRVKLVGV
jgi:predicted transcriptional regulator